MITCDAQHARPALHRDLVRAEEYLLAHEAQAGLLLRLRDVQVLRCGVVIFILCTKAIVMSRCCVWCGVVKFLLCTKTICGVGWLVLCHKGVCAVTCDSVISDE